MLKPRWYEGIPPAEDVQAHETDHPRPDGIRLGRIVVNMEYIDADDRSQGEWLVYHHKSRLEPYVSVVRLKAVNGTVLLAVGFTAWDRLEDCFWANFL